MSEVEFYYNGEKAFRTYEYGSDYYFDDGRSYASSTSSASYASSATSDSALATEYAMKAYAEKLADRMYEDNIEDINKDNIAHMIYAILMKDDVDEETLDKLVDNRPASHVGIICSKNKIDEFDDEDFLI